MGIIGAERNNIGVVGVAYNSKIMSISSSFAPTTLNRDSRQHGINWAAANGADVISNSWGWTSTAPSTYVRDAINNVVQNGRVRNEIPLGVVIVFSSGNNFPDPILFPGNLANVITVGAIERNGSRAGFSCFGNELNVVAPGAANDIFTTNSQGGYSNFGHTSAACPHVAGIAALILSANPNLKGWHVRDIIESTAQQVGGYNYQIDPNRPNWNNEMGYGLVNAYAAVQKAVACLTTTVNFTGTTTTPKIVLSETTIESCGDIFVKDVIIQSGAKLILKAAGNVIVEGDFEIELGSEFEIW